MSQSGHLCCSCYRSGVCACVCVCVCVCVWTRSCLLQLVHTMSLLSNVMLLQNCSSQELWQEWLICSCRWQRTCGTYVCVGCTIYPAVHGDYTRLGPAPSNTAAVRYLKGSSLLNMTAATGKIRLEGQLTVHLPQPLLCKVANLHHSLLDQHLAVLIARSHLLIS